MLSGDAASLRKTFDVHLSGDDDAWLLELTPTDTKARRRLQRIEVNGHQGEPRCFTMTTADGATSVLLLGDTAREPVAADVTLIALQRRCGGS
jgi:outer membrane lipoprotein-sorting protein